MKCFLCLFNISFAIVASYAFSQKVITLYGEAQGTTYSISYSDSLGRDFQNEIDSLLYFFDQSVSTYNLQSTISKINRNQIQKTDDIIFLHCFHSAKKIWEETHGCFDPTVYPLVNAWGFGPEIKSKNEMTSTALDSILSFVGFEKITIDENGNIFKSDPRICLDFNAFAQGYSVDLVSQYLKNQGVRSSLVEIGGEIYGYNEFAIPWIIGIETPDYNKFSKNPSSTLISIVNKGVATSGNYRKYIEIEGKKYAHHIDPRTGKPSQNRLLSITLISNQTIWSDATATGLLIMGLRKAKRHLKKHSEYEAMLVYSTYNGQLKVFKTSNFPDFDEKN